MNQEPEQLEPSQLATGLVAVAPHDAEQKPKLTWLMKIGWLAWIILCFELGAFLLVYPWMDGWLQSGVQDWFVGIEDFWMNPYFRGALSGLGLLNIYISLMELFHYLKSLLFG